MKQQQTNMANFYDPPDTPCVVCNKTQTETGVPSLTCMCWTCEAYARVLDCANGMSSALPTWWTPPGSLRGTRGRKA